MHKRNSFKSVKQVVIMGAREALHFMDVLGEYGPISRNNVRHYVLAALFAGPDIKVGKPAYTEMEDSICREVSNYRNRGITISSIGDDNISDEATEYLRLIIGACTGESMRGHRGPRCFEYDGFSKEACDEVRELLGGYGFRHLGISTRPYMRSLMPGRRIVSAMVTDDEYDDLQKKNRLNSQADEPQGPLRKFEGGSVPDFDTWGGLYREMHEIPSVNLPYRGLHSFS